MKKANISCNNCLTTMIIVYSDSSKNELSYSVCKKFKSTDVGELFDDVIKLRKATYYYQKALV